MLLESVGSVFEQTAKDPTYDPESALTTLSHAMETQILGNTRALGLQKPALDSYGDDELVPRTKWENESLEQELPGSSTLNPSSFTEENAEVANCNNKKLCFTCNGGAWNTAIYVTFNQILNGEVKYSKQDRCNIDRIVKLTKGAGEGRVHRIKSFAPEHECSQTLERHDSRQSANPMHRNKMDEIIKAMDLPDNLVVSQCKRACNEVNSDNHKYSFKFNNDPNIQRGYYLTMKQCLNMLPEGGAFRNSHHWRFMLLIAFYSLLSS